MNKLTKNMILPFMMVLMGISLPLLADPTLKFSMANTSTKTHAIHSGGYADVVVDVDIPSHNHIYIKHLNSLSDNILTSFSIKSPASGFNIETIEYPNGEKHDNDLILNEQNGAWKLRIYETRGEKPSRKVHSIRIQVNTQMCNSKTNQCYRPQIHYVTAKIMIDKPRQELKSRASSNIKWITSYNDAKQMAKNSHKNIYIIITAPSWCGYCIKMENETFTNNKLAELLNSSFVPLRILDSSSDLKSFRFSGYPTQILMDNKTKEISRSIPRDAIQLTNWLEKYAKSDNDTTDENTVEENTDSQDSFNYTITINGQFIHQGNGQWIEKKGNEVIKYMENKRGNDFIILQNSSTQEFIALPRNGGKAYIRKGDKWVESFEIKK